MVKESLVEIFVKTIGRPSVVKCIKSCVGENLHVTVLNDNSDFNIEEELKNSGLSDIPNHTLFNRGGTPGAELHNLGALLSRSKYSMFIDDDDELIEGAGDIARSYLADTSADMVVPGLKYWDTKEIVCVDTRLGVYPGNIAMVTYRSEFLRKNPWTYYGPQGQENLYDYFHVLFCHQQKKGTVEWYEKPLYLIRPSLPGNYGEGKN